MLRREWFDSLDENREPTAPWNVSALDLCSCLCYYKKYG